MGVVQVELVKEQPLRILQVQVFRLVNPPWLIPTCNNLLLKRSTRKTSTSTRRKRKRRKRKRRKKISVIKRRGAKSRVKRKERVVAGIIRSTRRTRRSTRSGKGRGRRTSRLLP